MVLKLLHQCVDLAPSRASVPLQDESVNHYTEDYTGEKTDHQPISEHLRGHTPPLPTGMLAGQRKSLRLLNIFKVYPKVLASVKQRRS
jgi:hypothetical protein